MTKIKNLFSYCIDKIKKIFSYCNDKWNWFINLKYIEIIFKILPHNFFVLLLLIISIITLYKFNIYTANDYVSIYEQINLDSTIGPILEKTKIDLSFVETTENFTGICFRVGTYARTNTVKLTLTVEKEGKKLLSDTIEAEHLIDGDYGCFDTKKLTLEELKNNDVYITPSKDVAENNTITIYQDNDENIAVSLVKTQSKNLNNFKIAIFIIFIIIYLLINYLINKYNFKVNKFLLLMLCYIIPILFIMPAYQVPDEPAHFYRAYHLSQYNFDENIYQSLFEEEIEVPSNIGCLNYTRVQSADKVANIEDIKKCFSSTKNEVIEEPHTGNGSLLGYIPQTISIKITDIFTNSPMIIFYVGRIITFAFSFYLIYLAIKITPKYKPLFLIVATMMMFIQQLISYSYDSILNSIALLYIAYILKLRYGDRKVNYKDWLLLIIMLLIMTNIKRLVYLPLFAFLLLIPKEKFKKSSNKNKYFAIILAVLLAFLMYQGVESIVNIGSELVEKVSETKEYTSTDQLKYLLNNPINIIKIAIETIKVKGMFYLDGLVGYFGWFKFKISNKYILVYLLLFIYAILGEKSNLKLKNKIFPFLGVCASLACIFGGMYLYWSDYMLPYVEGVQGRYFFPLLIPLIILLIPKKNKYKINNKIIYTSINILLLQYILTLTLYYY